MGIRQVNDAGLVVGPITFDERYHALILKEAGCSHEEIGAQLNRSVKSVALIFAHAERQELHEQKIKTLQQEDGAEIAEKDRDDYDVVAPAYLVGLAAISILDKLNRARKAAGRPQAEMARVHELALTYKLKRPELRRPRMLPPR